MRNIAAEVKSTNETWQNNVWINFAVIRSSYTLYEMKSLWMMKCAIIWKKIITEHPTSRMMLASPLQWRHNEHNGVSNH